MKRDQLRLQVLFTLISYVQERNRILRNPVDRVVQKANEKFTSLAAFQGAELSIVSGVLLLYGVFAAITLDNAMFGAAIEADIATQRGRDLYSDATTLRAMMISVIALPVVIAAQAVSSIPLTVGGTSSYGQTFRRVLVINACIGLIPTMIFGTYWSLIDKVSFYHQLLLQEPNLEFQFNPESWPEPLQKPLGEFLMNPINWVLMIVGPISGLILMYQYLFQIPNVLFRIQGIQSLGRKIATFAVNAVLLLIVVPVVLLVFSELTKVVSFQIAASLSSETP